MIHFSNRNWLTNLYIFALLMIFLSGCGGSSNEGTHAGEMNTENLDIGVIKTDSGTEELDAGPIQEDMDFADAEPVDIDASVSQATGEVVVHRDLAYPPPNGEESDLAFLDIFRVDDAQTKPLVLLVHGGSWVSGDKQGYESKIVPWWLSKGYVAAPINFRLASRLNQPLLVSPRDQARDIAAGLAWLIDQADLYHFDPENIVILGYSSGAHLVALLGTDETILREAGVNETHITATISFDVHAYDVPYALGLMVGSVVEDNMPLIRHLFGETEAEQLSSSPINFVEGWAAKSLVISVDADPEEVGSHGYIVSNTANRYIEALREAGHQAETFHDSEETHSSLVNGFGEQGDRVTEVVDRFIESLAP